MNQKICPICNKNIEYKDEIKHLGSIVHFYCLPTEESEKYFDKIEKDSNEKGDQ